MARYTFKMQRLYVDHPLLDQQTVTLDKNQSNYLVNVLRYGGGKELLLFNGNDGEWLAKLDTPSKKAATLSVIEQTRPQTTNSKLTYCFAPLKKGRLDYMVQKAVEMGVARLCPVFTEYTQVNRLNLDRLRANIIEAAEQCGILSIPTIEQPKKLTAFLDEWPSTQPLIFCDESDEREDPVSLLKDCARGDVGVLIGPEGGFSEPERDQLKTRSFVQAIPLGPRILRADTAAVAALALVQATLGDWVLEDE